MTKQEYIDELYIQRDHTQCIEDWQNLTLQIMKLEEEVDLEGDFTS